MSKTLASRIESRLKIETPFYYSLVKDRIPRSKNMGAFIDYLAPLGDILGAGASKYIDIKLSQEVADFQMDQAKRVAQIELERARNIAEIEAERAKQEAQILLMRAQSQKELEDAQQELNSVSTFLNEMKFDNMQKIGLWAAGGLAAFLILKNVV